MISKMSGEAIRVSEVDYEAEMPRIRAIRFEVFVDEQKVPAELEMDDQDAVSRHVLAYCGDEAVGPGRLLSDGHIGRVAVKASWRRKGVGEALMKSLIQMAESARFPKALLTAQTQAIPFYEKLGFEVSSGVYLEAGIDHVDMVKVLG